MIMPITNAVFHCVMNLDSVRELQYDSFGTLYSILHHRGALSSNIIPYSIHYDADVIQGLPYGHVWEIQNR